MDLHPYYDRPSKGHSEQIAGVALMALGAILIILWLCGVVR